MNIVALIARLLLGLVFTVFGLNGFFHFIPMPPPDASDASTFIGILFRTDYAVAVFLCQIVGGLLLLIGRFVPVGLCLLGPVIVNIDLFHLCIAHGGFPIPIVVNILFLLVFYRYWGVFRPIFQSR